MTGKRRRGCAILDVLGIGTPSLTLDVGARYPALNLVLLTVLLWLQHWARGGDGIWDTSVTSAVLTIAVVWGMSGC